MRRDSQLPELQEDAYSASGGQVFHMTIWRILQEQLQIQQVFQLLLLLKKEEQHIFMPLQEQLQALMQ